MPAMVAILLATSMITPPMTKPHLEAQPACAPGMSDQICQDAIDRNKQALRQLLFKPRATDQNN